MYGYVNKIEDTQNENFWTQSREIEMNDGTIVYGCLLYTSPSPRDGLLSRMPSSA